VLIVAYDPVRVRRRLAIHAPCHRDDRKRRLFAVVSPLMYQPTSHGVGAKMMTDQQLLDRITVNPKVMTGKPGDQGNAPDGGAHSAFVGAWSHNE